MTVSRPWSTCLAVMLVLLAATACQGYGGAAGEAAQPLRLVVFPAPDGGLDPATEAGLRRLSTAAGTSLEYVGRAGGGHVVVTAQAVDRAQVKEIIRRLLDHPAVAHAEEDRRVTIQNPPQR